MRAACGSRCAARTLEEVRATVDAARREPTRDERWRSRVSELDDLEDVALLLLAAGSRHDRADRGRVRPTLPDHLSEVLLGHAELEHVGMLSDDLLDLDLLRLVDDRRHDGLDELLHSGFSRAVPTESTHRSLRRIAPGA